MAACRVLSFKFQIHSYKIKIFSNQRYIKTSQITAVFLTMFWSPIFKSLISLNLHSKNYRHILKVSYIFQFKPTNFSYFSKVKLLKLHASLKGKKVSWYYLCFNFSLGSCLDIDCIHDIDFVSCFDIDLGLYV